jgi:N-acetylmuramoyl-L-alanine amidase
MTRNSVKKRTEMMIYVRSFTTAFIACAILLFTTSSAYPSYMTEAGRKYAVASQRLADLKKSGKKKKYRSYWIDCIRTFELVEKKYPKSPNAADACFDRAGIYRELYQYNKYSKDIDESLRSYDKCRSSYPSHARVPEALYRVIEISTDHKKDGAAAAENYEKLSKTYPDSSWTAKAKMLITPSAPAAHTKRKQETRIKKAQALAVPGKAKPAEAIRSIRHWSEGAYTRIVIDQSGPVTFQAQELKNPGRLVFDLMNARVDSAMSKEPLPVNDGILKQVRASQYAPGIVRIVLDLESIKSYTAFPLHDPERLVIDVTGEGGRGGETRGTGTDSDADTQQDAESAADPKPEPHAAVPSTPKMPEETNSEGEKLSLSRQLGLKIKTIAIDAGHGGHDPGAIGRSGLKEKNITLDVAKRLAALVKERLGCTVVMTRNTDVFIPLEQRPFIAKSKGADLFVSIHVNANRKRQARGVETYIQSLRASDREAMATAARENAMSTKKLSELKSELDRIFADLTRDDKLEESLQLAHAVQGSLVDTMKPVQGHVVNLGVKRAFFYVLINTEMPSILAEVGFISNPEEEKLLKKDSYRQAVAEALYQGVKRYVDARSPQMVGI